MRSKVMKGISIAKWTVGILTTLGVTYNQLSKDDGTVKITNPKAKRYNDVDKAEELTVLLADRYHEDFFLTLLHNDFKNRMFLGTHYNDGNVHELVWSSNTSQLSVILTILPERIVVSCIVDTMTVSRVKAIDAYSKIHKSINFQKETLKMTKQERFSDTDINAIRNQAPLTAKFLMDRDPKATVVVDPDTADVVHTVTSTLSPYSVTMSNGRPSRMSIGGRTLKIGVESDMYLEHVLKVS